MKYLVVIVLSLCFAMGCNPDGGSTPVATDPAANLQIAGDGAFGELTASFSKSVTFTVTNTGDEDAVLGAITNDGLGLSAPFSKTSGTCVSGQTLRADSLDSCSIVVTYSPTDASQKAQAMTVKFRDSSDLAEQRVESVVSGTGVLDCEKHPVPVCPKPAPAVSISSAPKFSFGSVIVSLDAAHTFTLTNTGNSVATLGTIDAAAIGIAAPYALIEGTTCTSGMTLAAGGGSCAIAVRFTPTHPLVSNTTIRVSYSGSNLDAADVLLPMNGTGLLSCDDYPVDQLCPPALPKIVFTDTVAADFGRVDIGRNKVSTFTLTNRGRVDGTLGKISGESSGLSVPFEITGGTCQDGAQLVAGGGSCTIQVTFFPQTAGNSSRTLSVKFSGANGESMVTRQIYGTSVLNCTVTGLASFYDTGVAAGSSDNTDQSALGTAAGLAASYQTGYNDGYAATYQGAYNSAYQTNYNSVYSANYQGWFNTARTQACPGGTTAGRNAGTAAGTTAGRHDGYQDGYFDAFEAAYTDAYHQGYDEATASTCGAISALQLSSRASELVAARAGQLPSSALGLGAVPIVARAPDPTQNPDNHQACYNQGYSATYRANSYQAAFNVAVKGGQYPTGYTAGTNQADADAKAAGQTAGAFDGTKAAQDEGTTNGATAGYSDCYNSAYSSSYSSSYNTNYNSLYPSGSADGDVDGTSTGYTDGYQVGVETCSPGVSFAFKARVPKDGTATMGLAPLASIHKNYGAGQDWTKVGPNGVILDLFVQKPMSNGLSLESLNRQLRNQSLEQNRSVVAPPMRASLLKVRRARQAALP